MDNKLPEKIYAWNYCGSLNTGLGLPVVDMGDTPWAVYTRAHSADGRTENKKPDDAEFERALSFFIGSCEAQEVDMWDRYDVIKSYAYGYKKLYWDLLASWADLKVQNGVLLERAQRKYKRVDLETLKRVHPIRDRANGVYSSASHEVDGYNRAIDEIKYKYGDLYVLTKEGEENV